MRLRKQKKVVAVTLATAIAVSTISASASAVSYDLADGDVTIGQDTDRGAFSYQGEDKEDKRTYVNEDKEDDGKIIIKGDKDTRTENTVTVQEDVKKTDNADGSEGRDVDIVIDGVNADTSKTGESTVTVGEGANVDLTVKDSTLTTGGNGIDIGKDLDGTDENKDTKVDLTLEDTTINQTNKNSAGLDVRQGSDVDLTLKGDNVIDGSQATGDKNVSDNTNVEGIRVGGEVASDFSGAEKDAHLTIKGDKEETSDTTEETTGGSLTIKDTTTGMVIADSSDEEDSSVTITDGADVTIVAGCGIHGEGCSETRHDGIHTFHVGKNANVKYVENHYAEGNGTGGKILNPVTKIYVGENSVFTLETTQIKGVDSTKRETFVELGPNAKLYVTEKLMTHDAQHAISNMEVKLNGEGSSARIISRSVAKGTSNQIFHPKAIGNNACHAHVQCDSIIMDKASISSIPEINANHIDAQIIHEAAIGRINDEQLIKLRTFGMSEEEDEAVIIENFLN